MTKDIKVIIAAHKKYAMPDDTMYIPVQVGAEGKKDIGYQRDNEGENISSRNPMFCELTGLYWAWKNLDADYVGLAHYRRHFKGKKKSKNIMECVLSQNEASALLDECDIILPKKRNYVIESIYDHYKHTHHIETLDCARAVIANSCPDYLPVFDKNMKKTHMHAFNMFIMRKELLDDYCEWLFNILFDVEKLLENKEYDAFQARYPGRLSELLLDVWIDKNGYKYKEVPFMYTEKINKFKKVKAFLAAKFLNKKYSGSF
nr:DUF4422 domain-containing protein [uncultured Agathobacter sp.]